MILPPMKDLPPFVLKTENQKTVRADLDMCRNTILC